jgi:putative lipase involved disintegration of autophagic bodies
VFVYGRIFFFQILIAYYTCTLKFKSRKRRNYRVQKKKKKNVRKGNI